MEGPSRTQSREEIQDNGSVDASAAVTATARAAGSAPAPAANHFPATYGGFGGAMDPYSMAGMMGIYQRYRGPAPPAPAAIYYGAPSAVRGGVPPPAPRRHLEDLLTILVSSSLRYPCR